MSNNSINVTISFKNKNFLVTVPSNDSIGQLKEILEPLCGLSAQNQKLLYKGKVIIRA